MVWRFISEKLEQGVSAYLIAVTHVKGSSPGKVGFKMVAAADGSLIGSIGGGVMEYQMVELARKSLANGITENFLKRQVHQRDAATDKSGMICSGEQTLAFIHLNPAERNTISKVAHSEAENQPGLLVLNPSGIEFYEGESHLKSGLPEFFQSGQSWRYAEAIGIRETVYIFGAGHISLPLSEILHLLDFRIEVFDNREGLSTFESNVYADKKQVVDFKNVSGWVREGNRSYVVIMTFGHKFDETVLKQMIAKRLKYLGMIGSRNKVKTIFESMIVEGYSREKVERVCSPIGLPIGGQTPAEIAVSIAAQIVEWRYKK